MMEKQEARQFKALYFDLCTSQLKMYYPGKNYLDAYAEIRDYLLKRDFTHNPWSGYRSADKMTDLEIFDLMQDLSEAFVWFPKCVEHFEVANVGTKHNLMDILKPDISEEQI